MLNINLYKQEVKELTNLLLTEWEDIRNIALDEELNLDTTFLLGFVETEEDEEFGLFYNKQKGLLKFEKTINSVKVTLTTIKEIENDFPQVIVLTDIDNYNNW